MNSDLQNYISNDANKMKIYNLLFTNFGQINNNWIRIKSEIKPKLFYDILFEILHIDYMYKLKNNIFINKYSLLQNFKYFFTQSTNKVFDEFEIQNASNTQTPRSIHYEDDSISYVSYSSDEEERETKNTTNDDTILEIKRYIFEKNNISNVEKYENVEIKISDLEEYIYFKKSPNLLYNIKYYDDKDKKIIKNKKTEVDGFYWEYFIWRKKDDENLKSAPKTLEITKDNFYNYKIFKNSLHGWSRIQLKSFLNTVILPSFLKQANLKINVSHKIYSQHINSILHESSIKIGNIIHLFISGKKLNNHILEIIDDIINKSKEDTPILKIFKELSKNNYDELVKEGFEDYKNIYKLIVYLKYNKRIMNIYLSKKIEKIKKKFSRKRFKWQLMCSELGKTTNIQTLKELALLENVENASMMSKREICKAFSEKLQKMIDDKNNAINNNKCTNDMSFLSGENIKDIQSEFFIEYEHNDKIYCDDVRLMKKQIDENKGMHPSFRQKLNENSIKKINDMYNNLLNTTINMEDKYNVEEELSPESYLQTQMTNLVLKTRDNGYINNQQFLINADQTKFNEFVSKLKFNQLLTDNDTSYIYNFNNLILQKTKLTELLSLKIDNDPLKQGNISEIATNLVILYNELFQ